MSWISLTINNIAKSYKFAGACMLASALVLTLANAPAASAWETYKSSPGTNGQSRAVYTEEAKERRMHNKYERTGKMHSSRSKQSIPAGFGKYGPNHLRQQSRTEHLPAPVQFEGTIPARYR